MIDMMLVELSLDYSIPGVYGERQGKASSLVSTKDDLTSIIMS
jgi:hypothetical protein